MTHTACTSASQPASQGAQRSTLRLCLWLPSIRTPSFFGKSSAEHVPESCLPRSQRRHIPAPRAPEAAGGRVPEASQRVAREPRLGAAAEERLAAVTPGTYRSGGSAMGILSSGLHVSPSLCSLSKTRLPLGLSHPDPDSVLKLGLLCATRAPGEGGLRLPSSFRVLPACPDCCFRFPGRLCPAGVPVPRLALLSHLASPPSCKPRAQHRHETGVVPPVPSRLQRGLNAGSSFSHS